ncbi:endonuclease/exonuclease/phosphatase family protein [Candidatus Dojkabacteria bacterium]|nr:endonuclease/exonuclease/phosphatase family protein [Candidatus Dojkabacteria bacterium]
MKLIFANVSHGFVYAHDLEKHESMVFKKFSIPGYADYFKNQKPDILCLSEALIDNKKGDSLFVNEVSKATGLKNVKILRSEDSWLYVGKHYGMAVLSRYPIEEYETFKLPNPNFETIRPNGDHWVLHDKYAQYLRLNINGQDLNLFTLHYFPVHHFKKSIQSKEMKPYRKALSEYFTSKGFDTPTVIVGDFNDKGAKLKDVFPELFEGNILKEAIEVETTICDGTDQLDHILYTHKLIKLKTAKTEKFLSDHYALISEFELP